MGNPNVPGNKVASGATTPKPVEIALKALFNDEETERDMNESRKMVKEAFLDAFNVLSAEQSIHIEGWDKNQLDPFIANVSDKFLREIQNSDDQADLTSFLGNLYRSNEYEEGMRSILPQDYIGSLDSLNLDDFLEDFKYYKRTTFKSGEIDNVHKFFLLKHIVKDISLEEVNTSSYLSEINEKAIFDVYCDKKKRESFIAFYNQAKNTK